MFNLEISQAIECKQWRYVTWAFKVTFVVRGSCQLLAQCSKSYLSAVPWTRYVINCNFIRTNGFLLTIYWQNCNLKQKGTDYQRDDFPTFMLYNQYNRPISLMTLYLLWRNRPIAYDIVNVVLCLVQGHSGSIIGKISLIAKFLIIW